jgi:CheY-like chemotaxis protein
LAGAGCKCPVVFTTVLDDEQSRREAAAAGGVACLRKPIRADLLIEVIIKAVG